MTEHVSHCATLKNMAEVGFRALKQNASAVVADVAGGEIVTITDRGRPVAQMIPILNSNLQLMIDSGRARPPSRDIGDLLAPEAGPSLSAELALMRDAETEALLDWIAETKPLLVAGDLARTELLRAVRRTAPDRVLRARVVLDSITLLAITTPLFEAAGRLGPSDLRTPDALHVASALALGDDLVAVVTYDRRLTDAAAMNGMPIVAPG